jgi:hypothetical protein
MTANPLVNVDCSSKDTGVLMYLTNMPEWVCNDGGEQRVTQVMFSVFDQSCKPRGASEAPGLMLDVGSNTGFYGLNALSRGCETNFFDLQPECQQFVNSAIYYNHFEDRGKVFPYGVAAKYSSFAVPSTGCAGTFFAGGGGNLQGEVFPLRAFVKKRPILMMKVDTEGNEVNVLNGAKVFFAEHLIKNAIVEITPMKGFYARMGTSTEEIAELISTFVEQGYHMVSLLDWTVHSTKKAAFDYIMACDARKEVIKQFDVWLTLSVPQLPLKELVKGRPAPLLPAA